MPARDAHAQDAGADVEAQGWIQHGRLAVDPGRNGMGGVDLERRRRPLPPWALRQAAVLAAARGRSGAGDPEAPAVDARPRARADRAPQPVAVVRDEDGRTRGVLVA